MKRSRYHSSAMSRPRRDDLMDEVKPSAGMKSISPIITGAVSFGAAAAVPIVGMTSGFALLGTIVAAVVGNKPAAKHLGAATVGLTGGLFVGLGVRMASIQSQAERLRGQIATPQTQTRR